MCHSISYMSSCAVYQSFPLRVCIFLIVKRSPINLECTLDWVAHSFPIWRSPVGNERTLLCIKIHLHIVGRHVNSKSQLITNLPIGKQIRNSSNLAGGCASAPPSCVYKQVIILTIMLYYMWTCSMFAWAITSVPSSVARLPSSKRTDVRINEKWPLPDDVYIVVH